MNNCINSLGRTSIAWIVCLLIVSQASLKAQSPSQLVSIELGNLPIILTAPHGGSRSIPNVPQRQGKDVPMFKVMSDSNTDKLTAKLADTLEEKLGKRPYVVIARFHRKFLDANRRASDAYESEEAAATYAAYHQAVNDAKQKIIQRWGHGLLLDIHGQAAEPTTIFRGTQNGRTTSHLIARFGIEAQTGTTSLWGCLAKQDLDVFPSVGSTATEHRDYDGGYTVITHGSSSGDTLDAIQLELGSDLRSTKSIPLTAHKIADAIVEFSSHYLPQSEQNPAPSTRGTVRIGVYVDKGAGSSVNSLLSVLRKLEQVTVVKLNAADIQSGELSKVDLLMQPGGSGGNQGRHLGDLGREAIRNFVKQGGGYVGFCAGAYLASADYSWSLNILDAKVIDREHWNRGKGSVEIAMTETGRKILGIKDNNLAILYAQGPLLAPGSRPDIEDYETVATFETEIAANGAPQGVMKGTTAIASGRYGKGRVICFSPHPELTAGLEQMVSYAIDYVRKEPVKRVEP